MMVCPSISVKVLVLWMVKCYLGKQSTPSAISKVLSTVPGMSEDSVSDSPLFCLPNHSHWLEIK